MDKELDALLRETLGGAEAPPPGLDARTRAALAGRRAQKSISLWWVPLICSLAMGLLLCAMGALLPWPLGLLFRFVGLGSAAATAVLTAVALAKFDLKEKGRVVL